MHWLSWHEIGQFFRTWQGVAAACVAVLAATYYGPRKVLETWDWYIDRFRDAPVLGILQERRLVHRASMQNWLPPPPPEEIEYGLPEIAERLKRSRKSVGKSLQRLRKRGKVEIYRGGWRIKT